MRDQKRVLDRQLNTSSGADDYVIVQQTALEYLAQGDVVTYLLNDDTFITHRLFNKRRCLVAKKRSK